MGSKFPSDLLEHGGITRWGQGERHLAQTLSSLRNPATDEYTEDQE
jgi:hypothetical protein